MNKLTQGVAAAGLAVGLSVAGAAVVPAVASAGTCTNQALNLCGKVAVNGGLGVRIRPNYGSDVGARTVFPGQTSQGLGVKDTDQVYVPGGRDLRLRLPGGTFYLRNTGWQKITDNFDTYVITNITEGSL